MRPDTLEGSSFFLLMLSDQASVTLPLVALSLFTNMPLTSVQIFGSLPFLFMIFFSTSFSPGAGVGGVKALRFVFARFYLWCKIPYVRDEMDACPADDMLPVFGVIAGLGFTVAIFAGIGVQLYFAGTVSSSALSAKRDDAAKSADYELVKATLLDQSPTAEAPDTAV